MQKDTFDSIVIGSGAGGLAAALCLARAGRKVLVLEQHYVPGGWCHSFYLNGHRFSPGVHYIGLCAEGGSTHELYAGLGIANDLAFFRMNPRAYEHCWIGDEKIDIPAGRDELYKTLVQRFPQEKKGLKKYIDLVHQVASEIQVIAKMKGFWDHLLVPFRTKHLGKYGLFSLKRVIDWHIKDPLLKTVLNVQCGDHGLPPSQASFPLHCAVMEHYFEGAYYPHGGGAAIVKAMTTAFKRYGGTILTSQKVKKILVEGQKKLRAVGVELENGERYYAAQVVSNADPGRTYLEMVGQEKLSPALKSKLDKTKYSVTSLNLFLTVDMEVTPAMDSGNIWMMRTPDIDDFFRDLTGADILTGDEFPGLFISCTTLKDPASFNGRYHDIEVVTFISHEPFKKFGMNNPRSEEYLSYKKRVCEKMLNSLEKILPGVRQHIVQMELGTPITNQFYINSTEGNVYGTEKSFRQTGPFAFSNKSEIENLYLCGASTISHGVAGAAYSGVDTAAKILNTTMDELLHKDPEQKIRIYDAEDSSTWPEWIRQKISERKARFKELNREEQPAVRV